MTIHLPKVNEFGGGNGGGGGSSSFPIIVTDSGSSLPSASGYQLNDTFLNTSDKKIYKAGVNGYVANTDTTLTADVDYATGIASGFASNKTTTRSSLSDLWTSSGEQHYKLKFKVSSVTSTPIFNIFGNILPGWNSLYTGIYIADDNKLHHNISYYSYGSYSNKLEKKILDTEIVADKIYILNITKTGINCTAQLTDENGVVLEEASFETENFTSGTSVTYGSGYVGTYKYASNLSVYLADSSGELLIPNPNLSWDSGTDLTDKTEYADKTNGILYLYQDTELIQIPDIDLSNYKLKATTTTIDTASVTVSEIKANTNYVFSNNAITDITLSGCETSFEETSINFTTGSSAPTFTDNANIKWFGGVPEMKANTTYTIVIFNKQAYWQEQENV